MKAWHANGFWLSGLKFDSWSRPIGFFFYPFCLAIGIKEKEFLPACLEGQVKLCDPPPHPRSPLLFLFVHVSENSFYMVQ